MSIGRNQKQITKITKPPKGGFLMGKRKCIWENEPKANEGFVTEIINTHNIVLVPEFTEIGLQKSPSVETEGLS